MPLLLKVCTVVSLGVGALLLLPWLGVLLANIMALAGLDAAGSAPAAQRATVMAFIAITTLWPLSLMASFGLAIPAWVAGRPGLAFLASLCWVLWALAGVALFALWGAFD
ncbi:MAG: hypothetical protein EA398_17645 [Deltaproteobacteria bacterium]|nr:MAG: hypothetical protein EA398_17645 [Deltaproteobacteria bacterium]